MLKPVNNIYKQKSRQTENVVKKHFVGDFKILEIFSNPLHWDPPIALTSESDRPGCSGIKF
jgi:hypothetical protein